MYELITIQTNRNSLAETIAANFDSAFLIPLSARYSTREWNAAMHQAIAARTRKRRSCTV